MKLRLNLTSRDFRKIERWRRLLLWALAGTLVLSLANGGIFYFYRTKVSDAYQRKLQAMKGSLSQLEEALAHQGSLPPEDKVKVLVERVDFYNRLLEASSFSWIGLLYELEDSLPPGISLSEIQPDFSTSKVSLKGTAQSFESIHNFLGALEGKEAFKGVFLLRQGKAKKAEGSLGEAWEFSISLNYKGSSG